ncbi:hypothetical protein K1719_036086 [Acacia pycnantha]|nr:hypothetical protein K1719_036086 [Acacia pycnantha]
MYLKSVECNIARFLLMNLMSTLDDLVSRSCADFHFELPFRQSFLPVYCSKLHVRLTVPWTVFWNSKLCYDSWG